MHICTQRMVIAKSKRDFNGKASGSTRMPVTITIRVRICRKRLERGARF
jgi:hypothetical protein